MIIETQRLILRSLTLADAETAYYGWTSDAEVMYAYEHAFSDAEVFSLIRDTNIASQNVAKRNGMSVCGAFVKHYYGIDMPHYIFSVKRINNLSQHIDKLHTTLKSV